MNLQIEKNIYELDLNLFSSPCSETPYLRDHRQISQENTQSLLITFDSISFDTLKNNLTIKGFITEGWHGPGSEVQIYIGLRIDTTYQLTLPNYQNGKLEGELTIGNFPSFYLKDFTCFKSEVGYNDHQKKAFTLTSKINENSILVFGLSSCYAEIFEIGRLIKEAKKYKKQN